MRLELDRSLVAVHLSLRSDAGLTAGRAATANWILLAGAGADVASAACSLPAQACAGPTGLDLSTAGRESSIVVRVHVIAEAVTQ
jgi:hypothetical protein